MNKLNLYNALIFDNKKDKDIIKDSIKNSISPEVFINYRFLQLKNNIEKFINKNKFIGFKIKQDLNKSVKLTWDRVDKYDNFLINLNLSEFILNNIFKLNNFDSFFSKSNSDIYNLFLRNPNYTICFSIRLYTYEYPLPNDNTLYCFIHFYLYGDKISEIFKIYINSKEKLSKIDINNTCILYEQLFFSFLNYLYKKLINEKNNYKLLDYNISLSELNSLISKNTESYEIDKIYKTICNDFIALVYKYIFNDIIQNNNIYISFDSIKDKNKIDDLKHTILN